MRRASVKISTLAVLALCVAGCRFSFDRALNPGELRGRLELQSATGALSPATDAHVQIEGSRYDVTTDSNGRFVFSGLSAGTFALRVLRPLSGSTLSTVLVLQNLTIPQTSGAPNALDLGTVVIAALGGVQGTVTLGGVAQPAARVIVSGVDQQIASGTGTFYFASLPPGAYQLFVVDTQGKLYTGASAKGVPVTVKSRAVTTVPIELNQLMAAAGGTVTGQVQAPSGSSVSGSTAANAAITFSGPGSPITFMTDSTGSYSGTVPPGVYTVVGHKAGYADGVIVDFVVDGNSSVPEIILIPLGTGGVPANPCAPSATGEPAGPCDANATCSTQNGVAVCSCQQGYSGDGYSCASTYSGMPSCGAGNGGCDANATCSIVAGQQTCTCNGGFTGNGTSCTAVMNGTSLMVTGDAASGFGMQTVTFAACATDSTQGKSLSFPLTWPSADSFQPFHPVSVYVFDDGATVQDLYGNTYYASGSLGLMLTSTSGTLPSTSLRGGTTSNPATGNEVTVPGSLTISGNYKCTPATFPTAPTNVVATVSNAQVLVSWTPPTSDGGALISSYTVTANPGGIKTMASSYPECEVSGLTPGQSYTFTVVAMNTLGSGPASAPSAALVDPAATVPAAPVDVQATAGNGQATVSWVPSADDGGSPVTGYIVTVNPGGKTVNSAGVTESVTVMGLTNGTAYTFTVEEVNAIGASLPSIASSPVTPIGPPGAPTGVTAVGGNGQITLSWTAPVDDGGSPVTFYAVTEVGFGYLNNYTSSPVTITNLTNGTAYTFTVTASNQFGTGPSSQPSNSVTPAPPPTAPGAPTNVVAAPANNQVNLTWMPPASDGNSPITGYYGISQDHAYSFNVGNTTSTSVSVPNGTPESFTVQARNIVGLGSASSASNTVTPFDPPSGLNSSVTTTAAVLADGHSRITLTATLKDATNTPLSGVKVMFVVSGTANQVLPPSGLTNTGGVFTASLTSTHAETKTVSANAEGILIGTSPAVFTSQACGGTTLLSNTYQVPVNISSPLAMAVADLNGDSAPDIVTTTNGNGASIVSVSLNNGNGTYQEGVTYAVGSDAIYVTVGDFANNGKPGIVTGNVNDSTLSLLVGNGDGTFQPQTVIPLGATPFSLNTGVFTSSKHLDLLVETNGSDGIQLFPGNGDGTFGTPIGSFSNNIGLTAIADFGNTGSLSLAIVGEYQFQIMNGTGTGSFTPGASAGLNGGGASAVAAGLFNADLYPDLVFSQSSDIIVVVGGYPYTNLSNNSAVGGMYPSAGGVTVGDFNEDTKTDIAAAVNTDVDILLGNGDGTFQAAIAYPAGGTNNVVFTADFNADGNPDLALLSDADPGMAVVMLGSGNGTFAINPSYPTGSNPIGVAIGDFNGDGVLDFATADSGGDDVSVHLALTGVVAAGYSNVVSMVGKQPVGITTGDFNNDGSLDLAVVNQIDTTVTILGGSSNGVFTPLGTYTAGYLAAQVVTADFNGDGNLDLAVTIEGGAVVLLGNGDNTFQTASGLYGTNAYPYSLAVADFNGDGKVDLATADYTGTGGSILLGKGDGTFTVSRYAGGSGFAVTTADFNGDGKADLAVVNSGSSGNLSVSLGNGDGTFATPVTYSVNSYPEYINSADVNGDGYMDLLINGGGGQYVNVVLGNGDGTFQATTSIGFVTNNPSNGFVTLGDLNGDGMLDVIVTDQTTGANGAQTLLNTCMLPVTY